MTNTWRCLSVALTVSLFVFAPRWSLAQSSSNRTTTSQTSGQSTTQSSGQSTSQSSGQASQGNTTGQITGNERFLRQNRDPGQMVGGGGVGVGNMRGETDAGGDGGSSMFGSQSRFSSSNPMMSSFMNSSMFNSRYNQRQQLRVPLRLGPTGVTFSPSTPAVATGPNLRVQDRLARIPQLKNPAAVKVEMEGQVAILRGQVTTPHERDLVARLVLLEPGVADVRNELQLASAPAAPSP